MRLLLATLLFLVLTACQPAPPEPVRQTIDDKAYDTLPLSGSDVLLAERRDPIGTVIERGYVRAGRKHGTWTNYDSETKAPKSVVSYIDGVLNGPYLEFDDHGRFALVANYRDGQLHGRYGKYRIGRAELNANYVNGQLDGSMAEYDYRNGKIKTEASYRMGKKHGPLRHYNEEGQIVLEYLYEDDERVSGGIVEPGTGPAGQ